MLTSIKSDYCNILDIESHAKGKTLVEPSDGRIFDYRKMLEIVNELNRPLTEEEAAPYRIK